MHPHVVRVHHIVTLLVPMHHLLVLRKRVLRESLVCLTEAVYSPNACVICVMFQDVLTMRQEAVEEAEEVSPSTRSSLEEATQQDASPDSPRPRAAHAWHPNAARVPARSSLKGSAANARRKPQMDPITESSSGQQDSVGSEEDLLQVSRPSFTSYSTCVCTHVGIYPVLPRICAAERFANARCVLAHFSLLVCSPAT